MLSSWIEWLPQLMGGLSVSLLLMACVISIGFPLGLALGLLTLAPVKGIWMSAIVFVEVFRGIPLLVVIYFIYFGFPNAGLMLSGFATIVLAHSLNLAAYSSEVFRAGMLHVGKGQREAASSLGLSQWHAFSRVILPQALRAVVGPLMSYAIMVFQSTSLAFAIGVSELTSQAFSIGSRTFRYFDVLLLAGLVYATICIAAARGVGRLETSRR